ncbi:hypothetical protein ADUPG1_012228 [Aduncisulcus paluster]|uniref:Uncharacterized protein n=1 Tax=Aduncisulcus paluster TaxID=2918883 RepID=A0ABQ5K0Y2_9EUKA|nr:hypothetical protein ADUPG1_012228 [Aduncisulcus paluster]
MNPLCYPVNANLKLIKKSLIREIKDVKHEMTTIAEKITPTLLKSRNDLSVDTLEDFLRVSAEIDEIMSSLIARLALRMLCTIIKSEQSSRRVRKRRCLPSSVRNSIIKKEIRGDSYFGPLFEHSADPIVLGFYEKHLATKTAHVLSNIKLKKTSLKRSMDLHRPSFRDETPLLEAYLANIDEWPTAVISLDLRSRLEEEQGISSSLLSTESQTVSGAQPTQLDEEESSLPDLE